MRSHLKAHSLTALGFISLVSLLTACGGGDPSIPPVNIPQLTIPKLPPGGAPPGANGVGGSIARSGPAIGGATSGISVARSLRGQGKTMTPAAQWAAAMSAAEATGSTGSPVARAQKAPTGTPFALPSFPAPRGGGGSSGGESQGSTSAATVGGETSTTAVTATTGPVSAMAANSNVSGGGYSSGGAGGGTSGSDSEYQAGGGGGSLAKGGAEVSFGKSGATGVGADGSILQINDPEDYFTRVDLNQNLFKIVQMRYQKIDVNWTHEFVK